MDDHLLSDGERERPARSTGSNQRRKSVRYPVELPCRYATDELMVKGTVIDLSTGGCRMTNSMCVPRSLDYFRLDVHCYIDDYLLSIELAVVRWSEGQQCGMEFIRMTPLQQERLRYLVAFIDTGRRMRAMLEPGAPPSARERQ
ncbi:MAG TPA: PilZ domain-containing protein [Nitrospira sp.]|nr:PilZ domain-containing protein [Nitrospira sp.]